MEKLLMGGTARKTFEAAHLQLLVLRLAVASFTFVILISHLHAVAAGLAVGYFPGLSLMQHLNVMAFVIAIEVVGSVLTALGLFRRTGPALLVLSHAMLALVLSAQPYNMYLAMLLASGVLLVAGHGRYTIDTLIHGE